MDGNSVRKNIRNVIEMFEARGNTVEDDEVADLAVATQETPIYAVGMYHSQFLQTTSEYLVKLCGL